MKTMNSRKELFHSFLIAFLYGASFYVLTFCFFQRDMVGQLPNEEKMTSTLDIAWYRSIAEHGYKLNEGASNIAFFILFPAIWKLSHLGGLGMSFLNIFFFAVGFALFCRVYKFSITEKLIIVSFPSLYFCFIPYTEALFVLFISLCLWGMANKKRYIIWLSLFLVSLTRPTAMVLLPAFLIMEIITNERKNIFKAIGSFFINYGWPLLSGLALFIWYQYHVTGKWFIFFEQEKNWGHEFSWPALPFNSMYGPKLLWLNALAMFVGLISIISLMIYGVKWLFRNKFSENKSLTVSYLYLAAMTLETILFNPKWGSNTTNVYDLHRYTFATPFFWVFLQHYTKRDAYKPLDFVYVLLLSNALWLLFGHYVHITYVLYFNFSTAIILLYMLYANKKLEWPPMVIFGLHLFVVLNMFQFFLQFIHHG